ncbi:MULTISPECIES: hypothetical protein [unclassified Crossiella]|uniref:hypothetical protein n=1 Tax=unclassified Crossiella TaxID=2620835 RepID=UPI0020000A58|nr:MULTISPECIES: hypothetical protein [unclassified Crossiella]MCK2244251.1 hypothetical protein [Crossiella sp. S99.2]MCK2258055.1 hypothetical protein [Crossiella sp. S99.1]
MRPNVLAIFSLVALAAAAAIAVQQSPNFTSQTTGISVLIAEDPYYRSAVVPLPYRERERIARAPAPEELLGPATAARHAHQGER